MESVSRISSLLETARDLTLEAARDAGPRKSSRPLAPAAIKKLLDSRNERDVLDGLRRVIAMQYATPPQPTLTFFPAVLKTLSNPYPSTRPLVYNYLLHHAEQDPDTALLSINTIQKSLSDTNPRVRAMALKTMSGIKVPVISQIVSLAIKKGVSDLSPLVRKAAALACVKCVRLDATTTPQVEEYLAALLGDKQYYVAGAAVQAFMEICPEKLDMIHPIYRRLCKMVVDMDEWDQLAVLKLMTVYARKCFPKRTKRVKKAATQEERARDFYEDLSPTEENESAYESVEISDPDLTLFLTSTQPLLQSHNSAVILSVTKAYLYLSPTTHLPLAVGPLIALLRSPQDIQQIALRNIVQICLLHPQLLVGYTRHFLLHSTDAETIWKMKLEMLTLLFPHQNQETQSLILAELEHFSHSNDASLVRESVRAIGRCASSPNISQQTSRRCLALLLKQIHSPDPLLVGEAMEVIRHLIQRNPDQHRKTVIRLAKNLDSLKSEQARAGVVWLVGEFAAVGEEGIAADVLRLLVRGWVDEGESVRGQISLLAAKVYLHHLNAKNAKRKTDELAGEGEGPRELEEEEKPHPTEVLYEYTLLLARYTPSYDLRDRARFFRALLSNPDSTDLASLLLLAPKPVPKAFSPSESRKDFVLGSAGLVIGESVGSAEDAIPDWVEEGQEPNARLRDDGNGDDGRVKGKVETAGGRLDDVLANDTAVARGKGDGGVGVGVGVGVGGGRREKTLDAWLDEEGEEASEESGSEEEDEESEEEESSEEETESESGDERTGMVK